MGDDVARLRLEAQGIARPDAETAEAVVTRLGAMQAQDYPGALWSIGLRMPDAKRVDVERAIAARTIVRTWPMRGTLHYVPAVDARWMLELLTPRVIRNVAGRHRRLELDDATFRRSRILVTRALSATPVMTRADLFEVLEQKGISTVGQRGIHILQLLCMQCVLCQGPHTDKQSTFALFDEWITTSRALDRDEALQTLAERFFRSHGPATLRDFAGWTGLPMADARRALGLAMPVLERIAADGEELWMAADRAVEAGGSSRAHLLPGFDEYMLGYKDRGAALAAEHAGRIVPGGNGMFLATLVLDGQVVGTWRRVARAKRIDVEVVPFAPLPAAQRKLFAAPAERYARFLGTPVSIEC